MWLHLCFRLLIMIFAMRSSIALSTFVFLSMTTACDGGAKTDPATAKAPSGDAKAPTGDAKAPTGDAKAPTGPTEVLPASDGKAQAKPARSVKKEVPKVDPAKAKQNTETFNGALNAGRKAAKAGNYDEAISLFEKALKLDPNHPGALGELGWAAFKKGDLKRARHATNLAIANVKQMPRKGALLYNLGRIDEQEGNVELAIDHYKRSLSVRDNKIVKARIESLGATPPPPSGSDASKPIETVEQMCASILDDDFFCDDEETDCGCVAYKHTKNPVAGATIAEAAVFAAGAFTSGLGEEAYGYFGIKTPKRGWQILDMVGDASMPGISYINNDYEIRQLEFAQLIDGGEAEVVMVAQRRESDGDYSSNVLEYEWVSTMFICQVAAAGPVCTAFKVDSDIGMSKMMDDGPAPDVEEWGPLGAAIWKVTTSFADGAITIAKAEGDPPSDLLGTHAIADLPTKDFVELFTAH